MLRFWQPKRRKTASDVEDSPQRCRVSRTNSHSFSSSSAFHVEQLCSSRDVDLQPTDLRMVIMENGPKRVIFDSATIIPLNGKPTEGLHVSQCRKFQLLRKRKDTSVLAQLIWGAGPASHATDALKVHQLPEEGRIMISRQFQMPRSGGRDIHGESMASSDSESQYTATVRSMESLGCRTYLSTTAPPERFSRVRNTSLNLESEDSDDFRAFSPPHRLSKNRRITMSHKQSLCEPPSYFPTTPCKSRSRMSSFGSQPEDDGGRQVSLAVVFTKDQRCFVFQHIPIIEAEMCRLESRISNAAMYTPSFLENVNKAWEEFCSSICLLFNAPRLRNPVWLSLSERDIDDCKVATDFCTQLATLVRLYDTKHTKFFLSNVVSTVLMYHMSWVASVAAPHSAPSIPTIDIERSLFIGTISNGESASVPYNPHIAQFLEISGNVGTINRSTKTVVSGADPDVLSTILQVLSYFIRCSTVQASQKGRETDPLPVSRSFSPDLASPDIIGSSPVSSTSDFSTFSPEKLKSECDDLTFLGSIEPPTSLISSIAGLNRLDPYDFLGKSLLAGPSTSFSPHFIISGLIKNDRNYEKAMDRMCDEVRMHCDPAGTHKVAASTSLSSSQSTSSVYENQGPDNVIVLADVSEHTVKVLSCDGVGDIYSPSESIVSMFEQFSELHRAGTAPKFLITFLEDSLFEILGKSLSLVEMVSHDTDCLSGGSLSPDRVRAIVGCDHSDLRLILNVASVYYPCVLSSVV